MGLLSELRRRNVLRVVVLYMVAAWLIMQVAEVVIALANLPEWIGPAVLGLLAIGFPIAVVLSWFYELTPEGISLEKDIDATESITGVTGRRLDLIVISLLAAAVILFAYDKWWIPAPSQQSIAVLAFENMSDDPGQEYFSDGISEELLNLLAKIPELRVTSRSSAFSFKGKNITIPAIAAQLNVAHVLEGSVRKMGNRLRITAQLIEASSDSHLWSETYDRDMNDIFAVQDEIAAAIRDELKLKLAVGAGDSISRTAIKTASTDAYDAYLQGRELVRLRGRDNLEDAVRHLERSLRLDNNFAPAHGQLAVATALLLDSQDTAGTLSLEEVKRIAIPHLDRAQELEPDLAEAHQGRALLAAFAGDRVAGIEHGRKALASNPSYADAMNSLQIALSYLGRYEESDAILKQMLVADPLTVVGRQNYLISLCEKEGFDEAHEIAAELLAEIPHQGYWGYAYTSIFCEGKLAEGLAWALKLGGGHGFVFFALGNVGVYDEAWRVNERWNFWLDILEGRFDEAIRTTQERLRDRPDNTSVIREAAMAFYLANRIGEALPLFERLLELAPVGRPISTNWPLADTMALALARKKAGDEEGARAAVQLVRQDLAARRATGRKNFEHDFAVAMIAAFDQDSQGVFDALQSAIEGGLRWPTRFDDPIFEDLRGDPDFVALQEELNAILAVEHDKVLQLICFNNPVPDDWQPLLETCEGVVEQRVL